MGNGHHDRGVRGNNVVALGRRRTELMAKPLHPYARRLFFIDHLRVFLTVLVVVFHLAITYGADGSWYYREPTDDIVVGLPLQMFVSGCQAFFMGFFFLISGYLTPGSFDRKGAQAFLRDRVLRLGIPLVFYDLAINPVLVYTLLVRSEGLTPPYWGFLGSYYSLDSIGTGPLWFVETLLIFAAAYALWRYWIKSGGAAPHGKMPGTPAILGFILGLSLVTFAVRLFLPIGWQSSPFHLQFPFFPQYISLFILGILAYRRNWLAGLSDTAGRWWLTIGVAGILLFPVLAVAGGAIDQGTSAFRGGPHWQSLAYAMYESFVCIGMCLGLTTLFRRRYNDQGRLANALSANAYTVYLIFAPVIVFLAYGLAGVHLYPLLKFAIASLIAVPLCFSISHYVIRRLPLARQIL
jgi:glucans biosynthesis protein C